MIRYSRLDDKTRAAIINSYLAAIQAGATDANHAAAIAAHDVLAWKGRKCKRLPDGHGGTIHAPGRCPKCDHDADAYSVALTVVVFSGAAEVTPFPCANRYAHEARAI